MIGTRRFVIVFVLLTAASLYLMVHREALVPLNRPFADFPQAYRGWRSVSEQVFNEQILAVLRPTDYLCREFAGPDGEAVDLYVGYHGGGEGGGEIHSPKHCLPGGGWLRLSEEVVDIPVEGDTVKAMKAVYQKGERKEVFLYWFECGSVTTCNECVLKGAQILNSALRSRRDALFVRISAPCEVNAERAERAVTKFAADFRPLIDDFIAK